jgi:hypothetical protein
LADHQLHLSLLTTHQWLGFATAHCHISRSACRMRILLGSCSPHVLFSLPPCAAWHWPALQCTTHSQQSGMQPCQLLSAAYCQQWLNAMTMGVTFYPVSLPLTSSWHETPDLIDCGLRDCEQQSVTFRERDLV